MDRVYGRRLPDVRGSRTVRVLIVSLAVALIASCGVVGERACATAGGDVRAVAQLRFVDVSDGQIVFTFGPSPAADDFGVPAFTLEEVATPDGRALRVAFRGASVRYPDGTLSYSGPLHVGVNGPHVLDAALESDVERTMTWTVRPNGGCPHVLAKSYVYGKSPRAQVALAFGEMSVFTLESTSDFIGAPQDTPVQASGMGFAPDTEVAISMGGRRVWDTRTDREGNFDSGFNIGYPAPGVYTVIATDTKGHRGVTRLTVITPTNPFR
jgi:hypothetical protein